MTTMPLGQARDHLSKLADQVESTHDRVTITRHGHQSVVLISADDLDSLEETLDILSTPGAVEEIKEAEEDISRGDVLDEAGLRDLIAHRRAHEEGGQ